MRSGRWLLVRARETRLRHPLHALGQQVSLEGQGQPPGELACEQLRLVVAAPAHLASVHRHRSDRIEAEVASRSKQLREQPCQRIGEPVVPRELERMEDPLERAAIVAPGLRPLDRQRIDPTVSAPILRILATPRQRAGLTLRPGNGRKGLPAGAAAGADPVAPEQRPVARHTGGVQNDSDRLTSQHRERLQHGAHCIEKGVVR
jgi:hypothetical protein